MSAVGYIRQSRRADLDVALSADAQLAAIRRLAQRDEIDPDAVTIYQDMGRSGAAGKERFRPGYQEIVRLMQDGGITTVYAISMSRLARSIVELHRFFKIALEAGVRIVFEKETFDLSTPSGRLNANIIAAMYEFERDLAQERAKDNVAVRRSKGLRMGKFAWGERPGQDPAVVLAAYRRAGSFTGAAKILNGDGVPTAHDRTWTNNQTRSVLTRFYPDEIPVMTPTGRRPTPKFTLYHLLRCSCGRLMTAANDSNRKGRVFYRCFAGYVVPGHPRPFTTSEIRILPWVQAEVARLRITDPKTGELVTEVTMSERQSERDALQAEREQVLTMFQRKWIDEAEADRRIGEVDERSAQLVTAADVAQIPEIDWSWPPETLNALLRRLLVEVTMDEHLEPVEAVWTMRAWRSAD